VKAQARAEAVLSKELLPGDLFSTAGSEYWDTALDRASIGERAFIRTNAPCPADQEGVPIFRITIRRIQ